MAKDKSKKTGDSTLTETQATLLGKVLGDVDPTLEVEAEADAKQVQKDEITSDTKAEANTESQETEVKSSDMLLMAQKYAEASASLATAEAKVAQLQQELDTEKALSFKVKADCSLLQQAAAHACQIYAIQLGKPQKDYNQVNIPALSNTFVSLRKEFQVTYPEAQSSQVTEEAENSPVEASVSNIHPISMTSR